MKKLFLVLFIPLFAFHLFAQIKVRFIVEEKFEPKHDTIYITGNFNNWNPGDIKFKLQPTSSIQKSIVLNLAKGFYEYKFTRGDWPVIEKNNLCEEVENRKAEIQRDTTIYVTIENWMDECNVDRLNERLKSQNGDTDEVNTLLLLSNLALNNSDGLVYANKALTLAEKINFKKGKGDAYSELGDHYFRKNQFSKAREFYFIAIQIDSQIGYKSRIAKVYASIGSAYAYEGNYPAWLQNTYSAIKFYEESNDKFGMANSYNSIGDYYFQLGNYQDALKNYFLSLELYKKIESGDGTWGIAKMSNAIGDTYFQLEKYDEAFRMDSISLATFQRLKINYGIAGALISMGDIYTKQGELALKAGDKITVKKKYTHALENYTTSLKLYAEIKDTSGIASALINLGSINTKLKDFATAKKYLNEGMNLIRQQQNNMSGLRDGYEVLTELDTTEGNYTLAFKNYEKYILYRDSLSNQFNLKKSVQIQMQYDFDKKESIAKAVQDKKDADTKRLKNQQYFAIGALGIVVLAVVIIALIQFRNNKQKQKANLLLERQKQKVETTLSELKSTQAQLIQSEKMASLGELTAGIAHEIQNPLNFVNNFSEVNKEMLEELKAERLKPKAERDEQTEDDIIKDVINNEEKINHHGKRAGDIVKGMLEHSRTSTGIKEPTDINKLADEYLRLSYHGLRAKDKSFNADFKTNFDESIGKINIVSQDIGRVLLNLINNAFYAVNEKKNLLGFQNLTGLLQYQPLVSVQTEKINNNIEIRVSDNGNGIPQNIVDKIFQPFFTTKPTGQGTGLGLSLSYDIIKAHGGEIKVESKEGSTFIIQLPTT